MTAPFAPPLFVLDGSSAVRLPEPVAARRSRVERSKIWDLPGTCHCVTIGTCLTLAELRRLSSRLGLFRGAERMTDYELHGAYVQAMDGRNRVSVAVHKLLESKHEGAVRRAMRCADDAELGRFWDEAVGEGQIPGAFWALLTHPGLPPALEKRVFGEVHMMSHLCGASHRGDARAIALVERQRTALAQRIAAAEADFRLALVARDDEIARLKRLVAVLEPYMHRAGELSERVTALEGGSAFAEIRAAVERQRRDLDLLSARCTTLEGEKSLLAARAAEAERRAEAVADRWLEATRRTVPARESRCPLDLAGRRIAYIGGRPQTVARIRALVERCNGCLLAHDGGFEQSAHVLDGILEQADIVVVPVDCVSHNAMEKARSACLGRSAVFAPLVSSSFSAFAAAIDELIRERAEACGAPSAGGSRPASV